VPDGLAVVLEDVLLETVEGHGDEEPRRDDAVGVDIVAAQRNAAAVDLGNLCHDEITNLRID
jgi:hypothetical protein